MSDRRATSQPRRALERPAPQDRRPRLARLRGPRLHGRRQGRHEAAHAESSRRRRLRARASEHRRRRLPRRGRTRRCSSPEREARRPTIPQFRAAVADVQHRLQGDRRRRKIGRTRTPRATGGVSDDGHSAMVALRDPRRHRDDAASRRPSTTRRRSRRRPPTRRTPSSSSSSSATQLRGGLREDLQRRPHEGGAALAAAHAGRPAARRSARCSPPASRCCSRSPPSWPRSASSARISQIVAGRGVDQARHAAHRPGRGRRLLAVLPATGARGASRADATSDAAIEAAAATSGRAVLVSGLTVMIAMAGMYLAGAPTFTRFATGTILVVAVAMLGSLTVLPALLSKIGRPRVEPRPHPRPGVRLKRRVGEARRSGRASSAGCCAAR